MSLKQKTSRSLPLKKGPPLSRSDVLWRMKIRSVGRAHTNANVTKICEIPRDLSLIELGDFILESFRFRPDIIPEFFIAPKVHDHHPQMIYNETTPLHALFPLKDVHHLYMRVDDWEERFFEIIFQWEKKKSLVKENYPSVLKHIGPDLEPSMFGLYEAWL